MPHPTFQAASRVRLCTWDEDEVIQTARSLRTESGGASVAFTFVSPDFRPHLADFIEIIQVEGHARQVIGCSADGFIGTGEENESVAGYSALFLNAPHSEFTTWAIDADFQLPTPMPEGGAWIVLGNPLRLNAQLLLEDLNRARPGIPVYGGLAGGGWEPDNIFLFKQGMDATDSAGLLVHIKGLKVGGIVSQGCQPIGESYTITRVEQNIVYAVGGRRAYDVLVETFEGLPENDRAAARGNIMAGLAADEYRDEFRHGDFLIRNIIGGDPNSGALKLGAVPRVGQTIQFQLRERDAADMDLRSKCKESKDREGTPAAALIFTCGGRGQHLFGVPNHDAGILSDTFGPLPTAGFFANGEIGPVAGLNFMHGYTASAALFYA